MTVFMKEMIDAHANLFIMTPQASNMAENVWTWYTPADFADEEPKPEKFAIRFKLEETFKKFQTVFEAGCKENASIAASGPPRPTLAEVAKPLTVKKAEGSWKCDTCLVSNPPGSTACAACQTPKPGAAPATAASGAGVTKSLRCSDM